MRRMMALSFIILFLALVLLQGCATTPTGSKEAEVKELSTLTSAKEVPITEENLALLKGKWEGYRRGMGQTGRILELESMLEIFNNELPLRGELTHFNVRGGGDQNLPFSNGVIDKKGRLFIEWDGGKYWIRLNLIDGKMMDLKGKDSVNWEIYLEKKK